MQMCISAPQYKIAYIFQISSLNFINSLIYYGTATIVKVEPYLIFDRNENEAVEMKPVCIQCCCLLVFNNITTV